MSESKVEVLKQRIHDLEHENALLKNRLDSEPEKNGIRSIDNEVSKSDDIYQRLLDHVEVGIGYYDVNGIVLYMNNKSAEYMNMTPEDMTGKSILEIFGQDNGNEYLNRLLKTVKDDKPYFYEDSLRRGEDNYYFQSAYSPVHDNEGTVSGVQVVLYDISKIIKAEADLRKSQVSLKAIIENTDAIISLRDRQGRILESNKAFRDVIKEVFDVDYNYGMKIQDFMPPERKKEWQENVNRVLNGEIFSEEFPFTFPEGETRYFNLSFTPVFDRDSVIGFTEYTRDITGSKKIEIELKNNEEKFRSIFERADLGIALVKDGKLFMVNPALERISGFAHDELIGMNFLENVHEDDKGRLHEYYKRRKTGKPAPDTYEAKFLRKDGSEFYAEVNSSLISLGYDKVSMVMVNDISEKKESLKKLESALSLLDETQKIGKIGGWEYDLVNQQGVWTDEVYRIHGLKKTGRQVSIQDALQFYAEEDRHIIDTAFKEAVEKGKPYELELTFTDTEGNEKWIRTIGKPVKRKGKITKIVGYIHDITDEKRSENLLHENQKLFSVIAENYPNSYVSLINRDLVCLFSSGQEFKKQGIDPKTYDGIHIDNIFGGNAPEVKKYYLKTFEGFEQEFELNLEDQHQRHRTVPLEDDDGKIRMILAVVENITERKISQILLEEANRSMKEAVKAGNIGLWNWNLVTDELQFSSEWKKQLGHDEDNLENTIEEWKERVHPDDRESIQDQVRECIDGMKQDYRTEYRLRHKDGSYRWIMSQASVFPDDKGRPAVM